MKIVFDLPTLLVAIVIIGLTSKFAHTQGEALKAKTKAQAHERVELTSWASEYGGLKPTVEQFARQYLPLQKFPDQLSVYKFMKIEGAGLRSTPAAMMFDKVEPHTYKDLATGLVKICLSTQGDTGFLLGADSHDALLKGLNTFLDRPDVIYDNISITTQEKTTWPAQAYIGGLCLLTRQNP